MSVFYAYSNNRDKTRITYEKVCDNVDNNIDVVIMIQIILINY